ncbi:hypothetical protein J0H58_13175 [bacterium]|nr:hypothetical protein [bacterium]
MTAFEAHRARFAALVTDLTKMAHAQFRDLAPEARDEAVQNTLALTWHGYVGLIRQGRGDEPGIVQSVLWYAAKQTRAGRTVPSGEGTRPKDFYAHAKRGRLRLEYIELHEFVSDTTPVPEAVSFRLDFPVFLGALTARQRAVALDLMDGMGTGECAAKHGVTAAAISQTRTRITPYNRSSVSSRRPNAPLRAASVRISSNSHISRSGRSGSETTT